MLIRDDVRLLTVLEVMWLFGRSSTSSESVESTSSGSVGVVGEATHAERQRNRQITWLREEVEDVAELERDRRYRTSFKVQGTTVSLEIFLSDRFPLEGPVVTASPRFVHPWVDSQMLIVGCPLLQQFTPHSNLGSAIKQVINELTNHPPQFGSTMATYPPPVPTPYSGPGPDAFASSTAAGSYSFAPYSFSSMPQPVVPTSSPSPPVATRGYPSSPPVSSPSFSSSSATGRTGYSIPDKLPKISDKSDEELEHYLNDEDAVVQIDQYISKLEVIKRVQSEMEALFQDNEDLAKSNMEMEPQIQAQWSALQEKLIELQSLKDGYENMRKKQSQLIAKYDRGRVSMQLKTLSQEADTNSDVLADDFLERKMDGSTFLQKFLQERKLYHFRSQKLEMLKYQRS